MPLGIVSDDEFQKELDNSLVEITDSEISIGHTRPKIQEIDNPGRKEGDVNVPESLRSIIGETHALEGRSEAVKLAKEFGLSSSSVSAYGSGKTSTSSSEVDSHLSNFLKERKQRASKKASLKLLKALDHITDEKLENTPAGVLAGIAKSLSGVVKDLEPEVRKEGGNAAQFIVFAPSMAREDKFDVIDLHES